MQQQEGANVEEADMNEKMRNEIEQLIQKEVARAVFQERLRMQREKQRQEALVREQKKQYSRLGFCFTAFFGITLAVQVGAVGIFTLFAPELVKTLQQTTWFFALLSAAPMYLVAFPAVMALLVLIKPVPPLGGDCFHTQDLVLLGVMGMGVGFGGNILSQVLDFFLSNGSAESAAEEVLMNSNMLLDLAISVFAAPVVEELLFRKCFIGRIGGYGERTAVILSGLLFGLAHGNIQQFFYAFGLGMIWAYVYVRTRNIGYTIAFHMLFNLIGGIFAMSVYQGMMGNEDPFSIGKGEILYRNRSYSGLADFMQPFIHTLFFYEYCLHGRGNRDSDLQKKENPFPAGVEGNSGWKDFFCRCFKSGHAGVFCILRV